MNEDFAPDYYVISPEEAEQIGLNAVPWYAMPAVKDGRIVTAITAHIEAVEIIGQAGRNEPVRDAEVEWALSVTGLFEGEPADWKRRPWAEQIP